MRYWVARESKVYPERNQMGKKQPTHLSLPYDHYLVAQYVIKIAGNESHSRGGGGPVRKDTSPFKKIQKPTGEFESVNMLSSDSGRDIDVVKGAGGVLKAGEGRNQIPFCVDEIKHHHFAVVY